MSQPSTDCSAGQLRIKRAKSDDSFLLGWKEIGPVRGEALLLAGHISEAVPIAERALDLCRAQKQRGLEAEARRICGDIHMAQNPADLAQAEEAYGQATLMADELENRPLAAHCHRGLGKLYRRMGQRQRAQEHFTRATTMYRKMDMTYWLEKAEAEMGAIT